MPSSGWSAEIKGDTGELVACATASPSAASGLAPENPVDGSMTVAVATMPGGVADETVADTIGMSADGSRLIVAGETGDGGGPAAVVSAIRSDGTEPVDTDTAAIGMVATGTLDGNAPDPGEFGRPAVDRGASDRDASGNGASGNGASGKEASGGDASGGNVSGSAAVATGAADRGARGSSAGCSLAAVGASRPPAGYDGAARDTAPAGSGDVTPVIAVSGTGAGIVEPPGTIGEATGPGGGDEASSPMSGNPVPDASVLAPGNTAGAIMSAGKGSAGIAIGAAAVAGVSPARALADRVDRPGAAAMPLRVPVAPCRSTAAIAADSDAPAKPGTVASAPGSDGAGAEGVAGAGTARGATGGADTTGTADGAPRAGGPDAAGAAAFAGASTTTPPAAPGCAAAGVLASSTCAKLPGALAATPAGAIARGGVMPEAGRADGRASGADGIIILLGRRSAPVG